jgi:sugar fermentation stimulation protein A
LTVLLAGLTKATLIKRYKRFLADVEMPDGEIITVHCPNPGSMIGIAESGMKVLLAKSANLKRKLPWTLQFVDADSSLVLVESALANKLFFEAFTASIFAPLRVYSEARAEHTFKDSRLDFLLSGLDGHCLVEIKSTTYLDAGVALFPDAQTERGRKHLRTLGDGLEEGFEALQFYVVARADAGLFKPAEAIDLAYAQALRQAEKKGVQIMAYSLRFKPIARQESHMVDLEVMIDKAIPIDLT